MTHLRPLLLSVTLLLVSTVFASVSNNFSEKFTEANLLMEEELWEQSIDIWKDLIKDHPDNANLHYKIGYCYLHSANEKSKASDYLEKAAEMDMDKRYDPFSTSEESAPLETLYYLAHSYHLEHEMDKAIAKYEEFKEEVSRKHHLAIDADRQIAMCKEAKKQLANPQNYKISNMGQAINSEYEEHSPVISLDESALFYTSRRLRDDSSNFYLREPYSTEFYEDIYVSYKDREGNWMSPELLNINKDGHAATVSVSPDGQKLIIYYDEEGDGQLYQSVLIGETWSEPVPLNDQVNSDAWETHASLTADGKAIFFVSDREGGFGGRDIYRVTQLPNGDWSKALSLGSAVNTEYEEDAVFISPDGQTLYFSSNGHESMGGFDIFYSSRGTDDQWSKPKNIGYPVNTVDDDLFFFPTADGQRAYYSSQKDQGLGHKDIYMIDLPTLDVPSALTVLKGFIYAPEGEALPTDTYIEVTNLLTNEVTEYRPRRRDGGYVVILPPCNEYSIDYRSNGDLVQNETMELPCNSAYQEIKKEIYLQPVYVNGAEANNGLELETDKSISTESGIDETADAEEITKAEEGTDADESESTAVEESAGEESASTLNETLRGIEDGSAISEFQANFKRYFTYANNTFDGSDPKFKRFLESTYQIASETGSVYIRIEGSASKVPVSDFSSNHELAMSRAGHAKKVIQEALRQKGISNDAITFADLDGKVQGPEYNNDVEENRETYQLYQYISVIAE